MSGVCTPGFAGLARTLGGIDCADAPALVSVRSPGSLANGTLPVVEVLMVAGAALALAHAVRRWRRTADPANLGLWCACVVYVLVLEPPLYFPDRFGLADRVGLVFVHNVFTVQFLFDRLPLYIVALYPALTYSAFVLVQRTGLLDRYPAPLGAACVATVFQAFYEVFDQLGPQLRWWAWNPAAPSNSPWLASVPLTSVAIFAAASPFTLALLAQLLLTRRTARGAVPGRELALRVVAVGALTPLGMVVMSVPYGLLSQWAGRPEVLRVWSLWAVPAVLAVVAAVTVRRDLLAGRRPGAAGEGPRGRVPSDVYALAAGVVFLAVFAALWAGALPGAVRAVSGRTPDGAPVGSLVYAGACVLGAAAALLVSWRLGARDGEARRLRRAG